MGAIAAPIQQGYLAAWEAFMAELNGPRRPEFNDMNRRFGVTDHRTWLQRTPDGDPMAILVHGGPGSEAFMSKLAVSENLFDIWFCGSLEETHGIDFDRLTLPLAEQRL
jgi:hypothetical protein